MSSRVTCEQCRDTLSAWLDGEDAGVTAGALDVHLRTCAACQRFAGRLEALEDALPRERTAVPDRATDILAAVRLQRSSRTPAATARVARHALAVVALLQVLVALVDLSPSAASHLLRDLGAFQVALAVGFLVASLRPATAPGLLPTAMALALCLLVVVGIDVVNGRTAIVHEVAHATELLGVAFVWLVARDQPTFEAQRA
jgi:predicted anti-sigma-YlaC factor YlaD